MKTANISIVTAVAAVAAISTGVPGPAIHDAAPAKSDILIVENTTQGSSEALRKPITSDPAPPTGNASQDQPTSADTTPPAKEALKKPATSDPAPR